MAEPEKKEEEKKSVEDDGRFGRRFSLFWLLFMLWSWKMGTFDSFERIWYDVKHSYRGMREGDKRITILEIDDVSIDRVGTYPWKRGVYAPLIENLNKFGAKTIAIDIIFADRSPLPKEDEKFAKAIREAGNVILGVYVDSTRSPPELKFPQEMFRENAKFGIFNVPLIDEDGAVRRTLLSYSARMKDPWEMLNDPERIPMLGVAAVAMYEGRDFKEYEKEHPQFTFLNRAGRDSHVPVYDPNTMQQAVETYKLDGSVDLKFESRYGFRYIPAFKLIEGRIDPISRREAYDEEFSKLIDQRIDYLFHRTFAFFPEQKRLDYLQDQEAFDSLEKRIEKGLKAEFDYIAGIYDSALKALRATPEQEAALALPKLGEESEQLTELRQRYVNSVDQVMADQLGGFMAKVRAADGREAVGRWKGYFLEMVDRLEIQDDVLAATGADSLDGAFEVLRFNPFRAQIKSFVRDLRKADPAKGAKVADLLEQARKRGYDFYGQTDEEADLMEPLEEMDFGELAPAFESALDTLAGLQESESGVMQKLLFTRQAFVERFRELSEEAATNVLLTPEEIAALKDGIVFLGSTATGAYDHYPSPFGEQTPGVENHANQADNILHRSYLQYMPPVSTGLQIPGVPGYQEIIWVPMILTVLLSFGGLFLLRLGLVPGSITTVLMLAGVLLLDFFLFVHQNLTLSPMNPVIALAGGFVVLTVHRAIMEQKQKRWIRNTFAQYLSPKVIEAIQKNPKLLELGGQRRDLTILFLDIAHFTNISEGLTPEELTQFLNQFLTKLTDIILKHEGTIDKYIGDCVMAFWNAPLDVKNHRTEACLAAIECQMAMKQLVAEMEVKTPEEPKIRVGLNSGDASVGNFGSQQRFSYTIIGDEVNLASRLEGANKYFGTKTMCSESTYKEAEGKVIGRELGRIRVVGKSIPIRVYELVAKPDSVDPEVKKKIDTYSKALEDFNARKFEEAKAGFEAALQIDPEDKPSKLYLNQCNDYILIPPPDNWENVISLASK